MTDRMMTINEVGERFRLSVHSLHDQRKRGVGLGALGIRVGRHLMWDPNVIEAWVATEIEKSRRRAEERNSNADSIVAPDLSGPER